MSENSSKLLFPDDAPVWYVARAQKWVGPFRPTEIYRKLQLGEMSWVDHLCKAEQTQTVRVCDEPMFKALQPAPPPMAKPPAAKGEDKSRSKKMREAQWFVYHDRTQLGPFCVSEVVRLLSIGQIHSDTPAWTSGMQGWEPLGTLESFSKRGAERKVSENRTNPRRPLVAQIRLTEGKSVTVGLCRDISLGGMQVLTDRVPAKVGERIRLNISPAGPIGIEPFVAKGTIVRILEDGRGFSFRFEELGQDAVKAIEKYFKSPGD